MGLLEDLQKSVEKPTVCRMKTIFDSVSEDEKSALKLAIQRVKDDERLGKSKEYSATWLSDVLTGNGYPVSRSSVTRHITGVCSCEQPF